MFPRSYPARLCLAVGFVVLGACNPDAGSDETDDAESSLITCVNDTCDAAAGEFCLTEYYANNTVSSGYCVAADCTDCDCAQDAAYEFFDGASNCDGRIGCSQSDERITVECTNAPM